MSIVNEKITELKKLQEEIVRLNQELQNKTAEYKAKTKAAFGLADGEPINVLEVVEMVSKVIALQ